MVQTADGFRSMTDRRKRNRRPQVKFTNRERVLYFHWYTQLLRILHKELRNKRERVYIYKPKNPECVLPQDAVRYELRHIFMKDWKCSLDFNDIDMQIHMGDVR